MIMSQIINQKKSSLEDTNQNIMMNIISFMDPVTISNLVLTSRKVRLAVGSQINQSFQIQKKYFKKISQTEHKLKKQFEEYLKILMSCDVFADQNNYNKFISQLNIKNKSFYSKFYSAVLNKNIKIENSTIEQQKDKLKEIHNQLYQALKDLKQNPQIPSFKIEFNQTIDQSGSQTSNIVKFISNFLKIVNGMQQIKSSKIQFKQYNNNKKYLTDNQWIQKVQIKDQYQKTLYYLNSAKSYHNYLAFNQNSIILSFLNAGELRTLYKTDKIFAMQIPKMISIFKMNQFKGIKEEKEKEEPNVNIGELQNIVNAIQAIRINKQQITEVLSFKCPPAGITNFFNLIFQMLQLDLNNPFQTNMAIIKKNHINFFANTVDLNFSIDDPRLIEQFEQQFQIMTVDFMYSKSYACGQIYSLIYQRLRLDKLLKLKGQLLETENQRIQKLRDQLNIFYNEIQQQNIKY